MISLMSLWAACVGLAVGAKCIDWHGGLFLDVPLLVLSRTLWDHVSIGEKGLTLDSDASEKVESAASNVSAYVEEEIKASPETGEISAPDNGISFDQASPRPNLYLQARELFPNDTTMLFAAILFSLESQLRRFAKLSSLPHGRDVSTQDLMSGLYINQVVSSDVLESLKLVLAVSNDAVHARLNTGTRDDMDVVLNRGESILKSLETLPTLSAWVAQLIVARSRIRGAPATLQTSTDLHEFAVIVTNTKNIIIKRERNISDGLDSIVLYLDEPSQEEVAHAVSQSRSIAWIDGDQFKGTPNAMSDATWLFNEK